ncbi:hypothetical protein CU097_002693 [Rhizopus azygosporus]|uniref:Uncharacterized protein n=1 Tax=Rhizopus azygosporus TaxID=86630 RepID=A0A367JLI2_RHIAZ|nr:hypothetical protein CU097_002693 [Rhizopus azygosporus]
MHNYAKLSDTHVADSVHGCIEADAGYSKNMNDQCANRSPNNLKVAMTFLENTLDQPLPRLLDFVWSYNYETNTPVDDIEAIRLTKCEKASASCKQLGIYHLGIRSKLFDGLGTVPRIECSDQQDTPHNQKDFLKLFECTSTCLLLDMMKHRCAS